MMNQARIGDILDQMGSLPTLPGIAVKILDAIKKEDTSLRELGEILSKDPPLSAKVLQIANSPFYGLPGKVTSVPHAVNLLGTNTVTNLALSFSIMKKFGGGRDTLLDYPLFWKRSLISAVSSKLITLEIIPDLAEDAFFLGLIHDMGILVLNECIPRQYSLVLKETENTGCTFNEAEDHLIGFNHAEVGAHLFVKWGLPGIFSEAVTCHHDPEGLQTGDNRIRTLAKVLHLSALFADFFTASDRSIYLGMLEYYAAQYGFADQSGVERIARQIHEQTSGVFPLFEMSFDTMESPLELIEEARKALLDLSANFIEKLLEQQALIEDLKRQATRDSLTNLLNYRTFHEFLEKECYRARRYDTPLSVIIADLDDFKRVNDTYGHPAGDLVLQTLAGLLSNALRKSDIIARYGGEEIAMIFPDTDLKGAITLADRLRKVIESTKIHYEDRTISITASIGISTFSPNTDSSKMDLIRRADKALYRAKALGKNRVQAMNGAESD